MNQQLITIFCVVHKNGDVCISILHEPGEDKFGYETASERWLPIHTVESILISVISMITDPNDESPANVDAAVSTKCFDLYFIPFVLSSTLHIKFSGIRKSYILIYGSRAHQSILHEQVEKLSQFCLLGSKIKNKAGCTIGILMLVNTHMYHANTT